MSATATRNRWTNQELVDQIVNVAWPEDAENIPRIFRHIADVRDMLVYGLTPAALTKKEIATLRTLFKEKKMEGHTDQAQFDRIEAKIDKLLAVSPAPPKPDTVVGPLIPSARSIADVTRAETDAVTAALVASFAAKYPDVGSHQTPGWSAIRDVLSFYPVGIAQQRAQEKFEEAAALAGNDYKAFGGHDAGQYVMLAIQHNQPLSDFYPGPQ